MINFSNRDILLSSRGFKITTIKPLPCGGATKTPTIYFAIIFHALLFSDAGIAVGCKMCDWDEYFELWKFWKCCRDIQLQAGTRLSCCYSPFSNIWKEKNNYWFPEQCYPFYGYGKKRSTAKKASAFFFFFNNLIVN